MGAVKALTADGLFIGQPPEFFDVLNQLARKRMRPNKNLKVRMRQMENKTMKLKILTVLILIALTITTARHNTAALI